VKYLGHFARFWYDFIVGDDWRLAAGTVLILTVVHFVADRYTGSWWLLPTGVLLLLATSVHVAARSARAHG
jgi:hypothetical protein